ncbi:MAG TPA: MmcQ/YjbR family DNA-binding protein [Pseudonocardiaceae bacterium]|nr:MmcQ/YjbR family DNA-binding protein [Pseudonocardiaceae bacterium]
MPEYEDVPSWILDGLRPICADLPQAYEELAWVGVRWRVRKRTFVHVRPIPADQLPVSGQAAESNGVATLIQFRAAGEEFHVLTSMGFPFSRAGWGADVVNMVFTPTVDWAEVSELLTESYRVLAPVSLVRLIGSA